VMSGIVGENDFPSSLVWFVIGFVVVVILIYLGVLPWGV